MERIVGRLRRLATPRQWALYAVIYALWGFLNNWIGMQLQIAEFRYLFQVITVYVFYLVPASLLVRRKPVLEQYAWGTVVLGFLELGGYALGTSIAHPDNIFDQVLGVRSFSLAMTLMFAGLLPAGNALVAAVEGWLFGDASPPRTPPVEERNPPTAPG